MYCTVYSHKITLVHIDGGALTGAVFFNLKNKSHDMVQQAAR